MHPDDIRCKWCGFGPLWTMGPDTFEPPRHNAHACPNKPPVTAEEGAAVAFGIVGMFEALRRNYGCYADRPCFLHQIPYSGGPCERCGYDDGWRRRSDGEWEQA